METDGSYHVTQGLKSPRSTRINANTYLRTDKCTCLAEATISIENILWPVHWDADMGSM